MATLRHALFADFVSPGHRGKPTIVGMFENVYLRPEQLAHDMIGPFYLFIQIDCSIVEGSHHRIDFVLVDADGGRVGDVHSFPDVGFTQPGAGLPLTAKVITAILTPFPKFGEYTIEVRVDGKPLERCPMLTVTEPPPRREG